MSGTSLDGIDGALCISDGSRIFGFGQTHYRPYSADERSVLRAALGKWQDDPALDCAKEIVQNAHLEVIEQFPSVDLIGFHGQTLAHDPLKGRTHQLGDGQALARACGKPVVWDFRSADMAAGGQGAPLIPFFHFALAKTLGLRSPLVFLNLGGVGNVTFVNPIPTDPDSDGAVLAFDTGPANAPINDLLKRHNLGEYDKDGQLAAQGCVDTAILERLMSDPYFAAPAPKSLDRDHFAWLLDAVGALSLPDAAATLSAAVVSSCYAAQMWFETDPKRWLICGGGRQNKTIMNGLQSVLDAPVAPIETVGFDGDMLEAQGFAYLAIRVLASLPTSAPSTTGCDRAICGGVLSQP